MTPSFRTLTAEWDPHSVAVLSDLVELHYAPHVADPSASDLPPYVRAVSALRRWQGRSVLVQDDVNALVIGDAELEGLTPVLLPPGPNERRRFEKALGNKAAKLDLEAATPLPDGRLLVLGSGSRPVRELLVVLSPDLDVRVVEAHALYAQLHSEPGFAGSELNVEGALVLGSTLRLLQRGNGATKGDLTPVNAYGDFDLNDFLRWLDHGAPPPRLNAVTQLQLGDYAGAPLSVTDAAQTEARITEARPEGEWTWVVIACAEASPNTFDDGAVTGAAVAAMSEDRALLLPIVDPEGQRVRLKLEGIEPQLGRPGEFDVVIDADDATRPALHGVLRCRSRDPRGPWPLPG